MKEMNTGDRFLARAKYVNFVCLVETDHGVATEILADSGHITTYEYFVVSYTLLRSVFSQSQ